jgi:hypothetical protein
MESLPEDTVAHLQRAGTAQRKRVIGAHNQCWKYLLCAITKHEEAKRDLMMMMMTTTTTMMMMLMPFICSCRNNKFRIHWGRQRQTTRVAVEGKEIGDVLPWGGCWL